MILEVGDYVLLDGVSEDTFLKMYQKAVDQGVDTSWVDCPIKNLFSGGGLLGVDETGEINGCSVPFSDPDEIGWLGKNPRELSVEEWLGGYDDTAFIEEEVFPSVAGEYYVMRIGTGTKFKCTVKWIGKRFVAYDIIGGDDKTTECVAAIKEIKFFDLPKHTVEEIAAEKLYRDMFPETNTNKDLEWLKSESFNYNGCLRAVQKGWSKR